MTKSEPGEIIDFGVDWLTVTSADRKHGSLMGSKALSLMQRQRDAGDDFRPWSMFGFDGWHCGQIQSGERAGLLIVRMWGLLAREHWLEFFRWSSNCSRLDLQLTIRWPIDVRVKMKKVYKNMKRNGSEDGHTRNLSLYQSTDGSSTVYIGQRASENYGRIYSKGHQTPLPYWHNSIRFEAEFKSDTSQREATALANAQDQREYIVARVLTWFRDRGCFLSLPNEGSGVSQPADSVTSRTESLGHARYLTDSDRRLRWLRDSCRLTVQKLIESGRLDEVISALSMSDYVRVKSRETLTGPDGPTTTTEV